MEFRGHQKSSFIDYPDKIATVYFTGGCNFNCPYCHNSGLIKNTGEIIKEKDVFEFLKKREKMIDAICISGGEPTLHRDLFFFLRKIRNFDYLIKLDTNGSRPNILKKLIGEKLLDYIAMDVKAPLEKYNKVAGSRVDIDNIQQSINIIKSFDIDYEFRTTICKELLDLQDIERISMLLKGSKKYVLQNFRDGETVLEGKGKFTSYLKSELQEVGEKIKHLFEQFTIRY